jgi:ABC-type branched-subunit amino acid transport system substrate-binding protein
MFDSIGRAGTGRKLSSTALIFISAMLASVVAGMATAEAQTPSAKIAVAVSTSGAGETYGSPALDGATLAVEEANADHSALKIELRVEDDVSNADVGQHVARQVIDSDTLVVVGPATTPMSLIVGPLYAEAGLVSIGTTATGDGVTANATTFRASFSTSDAGEVLANYLRHILGGTRAIVLFKDDGYGRPVADGFKRAAERLGIAANYRGFKTVGEVSEVAQLAAAEPEQPAIILAMLDFDAVPAILALRREGARGPILGTNAIAGDFFNANFASQPEEREHPGFFTNGVYAASPMILDSGNAETLAFADRYRVRFGHEPSYISAQGYEAARLAIAAVRATAASGATDIKSRRTAVRNYLVSLNGPANAIPGLNGPLWFTAERGRQQALRVGRFQGGRFESAPGQLVPAPHPDAEEIASGAIVDIGGGRFARRQQVVYTGIFLNEIPRVDVAQSTFTADFYLWMRFARNAGVTDADPTDFDFPDLVRGNFDGKQPVAQHDLDDGTTYRLWRLRGDFKNDYDLHRYPADRQALAIRFFNARAASDRLVYVIDRRSFDAGAGAAAIKLSSHGTSFATAHAEESAATNRSGPGRVTPTTDAFGGAVAPEAFRNLTQWEPMRAVQRRDNLVTESALGDPGLVGLERVRELAGFNVTVDLSRRVFATLAKTLLPLGLMALIMFASLYFPHALVKEKVTVAITAALSGAVLLGTINSQLGNVGYVIAVEYGFYVFFALCLLCIVAVLGAERLRVAGRTSMAIGVERTGRYLFLLGGVGTAVLAWLAYSRGW